jgi:hypothetical protein
MAEARAPGMRASRPRPRNRSKADRPSAQVKKGRTSRPFFVDSTVRRRACRSCQPAPSYFGCGALVCSVVLAANFRYWSKRMESST